MYSLDSDFILRGERGKGKILEILLFLRAEERILYPALRHTFPPNSTQLYQLPPCLLPSYLGKHGFIALTFV